MSIWANKNCISRLSERHSQDTPFTARSTLAGAKKHPRQFDARLLGVRKAKVDSRGWKATFVSIDYGKIDELFCTSDLQRPPTDISRLGVVEE
jgi:hypothetical protein